ncbi:hypothetical protein BDZ94DRAFT_672218 [Collybia nuda]|uniref:Uncharacterized protein n=1 Tax=Collybia nuda TaxID=64659 RepID=A0A9P5YJ31_9AGAR|nr:hypothetical protein BDZ94DRAFT_672218 [Collybia nuda]
MLTSGPQRPAHRFSSLFPKISRRLICLATFAPPSSHPHANLSLIVHIAQHPTNYQVQVTLSIVLIILSSHVSAETTYVRLAKLHSKSPKPRVVRFSLPDTSLIVAINIFWAKPILAARHPTDVLLGTQVFLDIV